MIFKKGNTYELHATIKNINIQNITKIVFKFNNIEKTYISGETNTEVAYQEDGTFIVYLSQQETLSLSNTVEYEVAIKFNNNTVKRSPIYTTSSLKTIIQEII